MRNLTAGGEDHRCAVARLHELLAKLAAFRGTARFTTWACKFIILEVSSALRPHPWRHRKVELDDAVWDRLA